MQSAIGTFDSDGKRLLPEKYTDSEVNAAIASDNTHRDLLAEIAGLQAQVAALKPYEVILTLPQRLHSFDTYELQNVVDLVYALNTCGVNWDIIKARLTGLE